MKISSTVLPRGYSQGRKDIIKATNTRYQGTCPLLKGSRHRFVQGHRGQCNRMRLDVLRTIQPMAILDLRNPPRKRLFQLAIFEPQIYPNITWNESAPSRRHFAVRGSRAAHVVACGWVLTVRRLQTTVRDGPEDCPYCFRPISRRPCNDLAQARAPTHTPLAFLGPWPYASKIINELEFGIMVSLSNFDHLKRRPMMYTAIRPCQVG